MKITKTVQQPSGEQQQVQKVVTIDVKPGWKAGTKVTFPEEGDERAGIVPADICFVLEEAPHAVFKREGDDLVHVAPITLKEALCGTVVPIMHVDGDRQLKVNVRDVVYPGYEKVVANEGMPNSKTGQRGNLIIRFNIQFPRLLSDAQKEQLRNTL